MRPARVVAGLVCVLGACVLLGAQSRAGVGPHAWKDVRVAGAAGGECDERRVDAPILPVGLSLVLQAMPGGARAACPSRRGAWSPRDALGPIAAADPDDDFARER